MISKPGSGQLLINLVFFFLPKHEYFIIFIISRSEQAPGSEFHPCDEREKVYCGFLGPSWCNKKVNPEIYVPCGSYQLLLSNVAYQMKEKITVQNKFSHFESQILLKF